MNGFDLTYTELLELVQKVKDLQKENEQLRKKIEHLEDRNFDLACELDEKGY